MIYRARLVAHDGVYDIDVISHEGEFWLVPAWLDSSEQGWSRPARIVRLASLPHRECLGGPMADFLLSFGVPKAAVFGPYPSQTTPHSEVVEAPDIRVAFVRH